MASAFSSCRGSLRETLFPICFNTPSGPAALRGRQAFHQSHLSNPQGLLSRLKQSTAARPLLSAVPGFWLLCRLQGQPRPARRPEARTTQGHTKKLVMLPVAARPCPSCSALAQVPTASPSPPRPGGQAPAEKGGLGALRFAHIKAHSGARQRDHPQGRVCILVTSSGFLSENSLTCDEQLPLV